MSSEKFFPFVEVFAHTKKPTAANSDPGLPGTLCKIKRRVLELRMNVDHALDVACDL